MNKKGQLTWQMILMGFIGIIVSLILLQATYGDIGTTTGRSYLVNYTITTNGNNPVDIVGQELFDTPIVVNRTGQQVVASGNYTISEGVSSATGLKTIQYRSTGQQAAWNTSVQVNVSYLYGAQGYIDDAAGRSVTLLIPIMSALAIVAFALILGYRKGWFDFL